MIFKDFKGIARARLSSSNSWNRRERGATIEREKERERERKREKEKERERKRETQKRNKKNNKARERDNRITSQLKHAD